MQVTPETFDVSCAKNGAVVAEHRPETEAQNESIKVQIGFKL